MLLLKESLLKDWTASYSIRRTVFVYAVGNLSWISRLVPVKKACCQHSLRAVQRRSACTTHSQTDRDGQKIYQSLQHATARHAHAASSISSSILRSSIIDIHTVTYTVCSDLLRVTPFRDPRASYGRLVLFCTKIVSVSVKNLSALLSGGLGSWQHEHICLPLAPISWIMKANDNVLIQRDHRDVIGLKLLCQCMM